MEQEEIKYVITNGKYYFYDIHTGDNFIVTNIDDILNLEIYSCKEVAENDLKDFINKLIEDSEKDYFENFYVQSIKVITKFEL